MKMTRREIRKLIAESIDFTNNPEDALMNPRSGMQGKRNMQKFSDYADTSTVLSDLDYNQKRELMSSLYGIEEREPSVYEMVTLWHNESNTDTGKKVHVPIPSKLVDSVIDAYEASADQRANFNNLKQSYSNTALVDRYVDLVDEYWIYVRTWVVKNYPGHDISQHLGTSGGNRAKELETALYDVVDY